MHNPPPRKVGAVVLYVVRGTWKPPGSLQEANGEAAAQAQEVVKNT